MTIDQLDVTAAQDIIEDLRQGKPPRRFVSTYSTGYDDFIRDVRQRHLEGPSRRGKIRFTTGSWGSGKTHILRLLREAAFEAHYLVSSVDLNLDETPFNKFEEVFFRIISKIESPEMYERGEVGKYVVPFEELLRRTLLKEDSGAATVTQERFQEAKDKLFAADNLDIDFRRMVGRYWATFLPDAGDPSALSDIRGRIVQWFSGEGTIGSYRSQFGVQKMVDRAHARTMLQCLSRFAVLAGYRGVVILLDEPESSYSLMRKSNLKQAHNNLLHLINNIDESEGLFMVYAATPDFIIDDRYGITLNGPLIQRIGRPEDRPPRALDKVWNIDAIEHSLDHYLETAAKLRKIFLKANPSVPDAFITEDRLREYVTGLVRVQPEFSTVSVWRMVVEGTMDALDASERGDEPRKPVEVQTDLMEKFRDR